VADDEGAFALAHRRHLAGAPGGAQDIDGLADADERFGDPVPQHVLVVVVQGAEDALQDGLRGA